MGAVGRRAGIAFFERLAQAIDPAFLHVGPAGLPLAIHERSEPRGWRGRARRRRLGREPMRVSYRAWWPGEGAA